MRRFLAALAIVAVTTTAYAQFRECKDVPWYMPIDLTTSTPNWMSVNDDIDPMRDIDWVPGGWEETSLDDFVIKTPKSGSGARRMFLIEDSTFHESVEFKEYDSYYTIEYRGPFFSMSFVDKTQEDDIIGYEMDIFFPYGFIGANHYKVTGARRDIDPEWIQGYERVIWFDGVEHKIKDKVHRTSVDEFTLEKIRSSISYTFERTRYLLGRANVNFSAF